MDKDIIINIEEMVFAYRPGVNVIDHLNLSLYRGQTVVLTGANGAGKTTMGKLLTGMLKPSAGKCLFTGEEISRMPLPSVGRKIGYCFQNPGKQLFAATVEEEIAFGLKYRGSDTEHTREITSSLLNLFDMEHLRHSFPHNLSWGEKRRVALAACLALEPEYLILDEPASGLDEKRIKNLTKVLKHLCQKGIGMLLISHNQDFIRNNAQRILVMEEGRIASDCCC